VNEVECTQAEFNKAMQEVQEVLMYAGAKLEPHYQDNPEYPQRSVCRWMLNGRILFSHYRPFSENPGYRIDEEAVNRVIYADVTR